MEEVKKFILKLLKDRKCSKTDLQISGMEEGYSSILIHNTLMYLLETGEIEKDLHTMTFSKKQ